MKRDLTMIRSLQSMQSEAYALLSDLQGHSEVEEVIRLLYTLAEEFQEAAEGLEHESRS